MTNRVTITTNTCGLLRILPHLFPQLSSGPPLVINAHYYAYKRGVCLLVLPREIGKSSLLVVSAPP